ncbi:MAG: C2H2-type zinc finger protein [Nitrososphaerales archaeon]
MERNPQDDNSNNRGFGAGNLATPYPEGSRAGSFQCRICGQVFTNQADLTVHLRIHEVSKITREDSEKEKPAGVG